MPRPSENRILVIRGGAIGDFILTLPVLAALRQQFPRSRLELLGYAHIAQLALAGGLADAVRSIEAGPLAGFFAQGGLLAPELREYFASFPLIISFLYDPDGIFQANVARCSPAQFLAGPHRPLEHAQLHATEVFLRILERLAIFSADPTPRLTLTPPATKTRQLALHPGSGSERKNWPETCWTGLLRRLERTTPWNFLLVGGEAEGGRLERLAAELSPARRQIARSLPLAELARQLSACSAYLGHDSGITHLAAALGLPGVVLWGDTSLAVWRPRSDQLVLLRDPQGLGALTVDHVAEELSGCMGRIAD